MDLDLVPANQPRKALHTIARTLQKPQHRTIISRHYGLSRGAARTLGQIAADIDRSPSAVGSQLMTVLCRIRGTGATPPPPRPTAYQRACVVACWLARDAVGDPHDDWPIAERLMTVTDRALLDASTAAAVKLLLRISKIDFPATVDSRSGPRRADNIARLVNVAGPARRRG